MRTLWGLWKLKYRKNYSGSAVSEGWAWGGRPPAVLVPCCSTGQGGQWLHLTLPLTCLPLSSALPGCRTQLPT